MNSHKVDVKMWLADNLIFWTFPSPTVTLFISKAFVLSSQLLDPLPLGPWRHLWSTLFLLFREIKTCFKSLGPEKRKTYIVLIGDSRIRNFMEFLKRWFFHINTSFAFEIQCTLAVLGKMLVNIFIAFAL